MTSTDRPDVEALAAERDRDIVQAKYDDLVGQLLIDLCDVLTERGHLEGPVMNTWLTNHGYLPADHHRKEPTT